MLAKLAWKNNMIFECDNHGIKTHIDAVKEHGGDDAGPTPKELVLNAMMGCSAMDVVSILKKMRQEIKEFHMEVEAEKTIEHPVHFKNAVLKYYLSGDLTPEKVLKAVDSSMTKYCGVNFMISQSCEITYKVFLNGEEIKTDKANFSQK